MTRFVFNRIAWLQALTILVLLAPLAGSIYYVTSKHQMFQQLLADNAPRYARLMGLMTQQAELTALNIQATEQLKRLTYSAEQDATQAGNDAQQRIRDIFSNSKLDIISIQVLPPAKGETKFDRIPVTVRIEGELSGIQSALLTLSTQTPRVLLDNLTIQTIGAVKPASIQRLSGQFDLSVIRVHP